MTVLRRLVSAGQVSKYYNLCAIWTASIICFVLILWVFYHQPQDVSDRSIESKENLEILHLRSVLRRHEVAEREYLLQSYRTIYVITPTHYRLEQAAELNRLRNVFLHVPSLHWILVEDSSSKTQLVTDFLQKSHLNYTHLYKPTPSYMKLQSNDPRWKKPRGVLQRNEGIRWLRTHFSVANDGVVYFADDDNTYSIELFNEMRHTNKVSVWPVGLVGAAVVESPVVKSNHVVGWNVQWAKNRQFATDMAGFALSLQLLLSKPVEFNPNSKIGLMETDFLSALVTLKDLEPKAAQCTKMAAIANLKWQLTFRNIGRFECALLQIVKRNLSQEFEGCYSNKNPSEKFFDPSVQKIMQDLTGLDFDKVFYKQSVFETSRKKKFNFVTEKQWSRAQHRDETKAKYLLQMPPVVPVYEDKLEILSDDPEIAHNIPYKMIFTDISMGLSDKERIIVVRDTDGVLRRATWEERRRMHPIYNPEPHKYHYVPAIFEPEIMKVPLSRQQYKFILDFACRQFEPEDPIYHRTFTIVYDCVDEQRHYEQLYSTRHYGPFTFYLAWNNRIDNLLIHYIHQNSLQEAVKLILLWAKVQDNSFNNELLSAEEPLQFLKDYAAQQTPSNPQLNNALLLLDQKSSEAV